MPTSYAVLALLTILRNLLGAFRWFALAKALSVADIGVYTETLALVGYCGLIGGLGLGSVIPHKLARFAGERNSVLGSYWRLTGTTSLLAATIALGVTIWLAPGQQNQTYAILLFGGVVLAFNSTPFLDVENRQRLSLAIELGADLIQLALLLWWYRFGTLTLPRVVFCHVLRDLLMIGGEALALRFVWGGLRLRYSPAIARDLRAFVRAYFPAYAFGAITFSLGPWFLRLRHDAAQAGLLGIALKGYLVYASVITVSLRLINPWLARSASPGAVSRVQVGRTVLPASGLLLVTLAAAKVFLDRLLPALADEVFRCFAVLSLAGTIGYCGELLTLGLLMERGERSISVGKVLSASVFAIGCLVCGDALSAWRVAWVTVVASSVGTLWFWFGVGRIQRAARV